MNSTPTAPTSLQTESATNPSSVTDSTPEFSAIFNDSDTSDTAIHYQIQVNTNSSFTGTSMWDSGQTSISAIAQGARSSEISYAGTTLTFNGVTYYWRIKFWDNNGTASPWSSVANFKMNSTPTAPSSLQAEGATNPSSVTDNTPEFSAIYNDSDTSDTATSYQIQVNTDSDFTGNSMVDLGQTSMWDSGQTSMSSVTPSARSSEISYAGTTLTFNGVTYYWRIKFWDNHNNASPWSSVANFTMAIPTAIYYRIQVNTEPDFTGTSMWDSTKTSMTPVTAGNRSGTFTYAGSALSNSVTYYWRIKFWDMNDNESSWSEPALFELNGAPTAPTDLLTEIETNPQFLSTSTPKLSAIFNDPDSNDTSSKFEIEVNTSSDFTGTSMWDTGETAITTINSGDRSSDITYAGSALSSNTTYYWRIKFWDSTDEESPWSSTANFKINSTPTAPSNLLIDNLSNPTKLTNTVPYFSAIFNDPNTTDTSSYYQLMINTSSDFTGTTMLDTSKTQMTEIDESDRSENITYKGSLLSLNGSRYY